MSSSEENIPIPILFNCRKHHKNFIREKISCYFEIGESGLEMLKRDLLQIGNSQLDLYLGKLAPRKISYQIKKKLKSRNLIEKESYVNWILSSRKQYRMISLSDKSKWTLRIGDDKSRYVHIHPGRYSINSIRIRALTLKTAIIYSYLKKIYLNDIDELRMLNDLRNKILDVPPLKTLSKSKSLIKTIEILRD